MNPPEISPTKFVWEKYISKVGYSQLDIITPDFKRLCPGWRIVGWCPANRLAIRNRSEGKAIMVESEDGEQAWLHCLDPLPGEPLDDESQNYQ